MPEYIAGEETAVRASRSFDSPQGQSGSRRFAVGKLTEVDDRSAGSDCCVVAAELIECCL